MKHHGMYKSPIYNTWSSMIQRCTNPKYTHYSRYGGRGIKVYKPWLDFRNFYKDMGDRPDGMTLDRIDNNGDYTPENCRWATRKEQSYNRSTNVLHTINGVTKTRTEWLNHFGIRWGTFNQRIYAYGWPILKALTTPTRKRG